MQKKYLIGQTQSKISELLFKVTSKLFVYIITLGTLYQ